ncbi:TrgA family protein [Pseudoroseicyclus aestuarii]|uniref:TrgA family protein n=1 Tax=Pseudoroseicyclus aestuarii TaxID=1795041 RepID=A0A318SYM2_9RHOB|nr:TrgA family protein [Pseudoroseicyclus aestuarii]PYE85509.1 hypothetical protein DFP88_101176 [Pseudoroseicyclus aestuarii]
MPTAARLVAALMLGALGWEIAGWISPVLPASVRMAPQAAPWIGGGLGLVVGWRLGRHPARGLLAWAGQGLTLVAVLVFWMLLTCATLLMGALSLRGRYDTPLEALEAAVRLMGEMAGPLLAPRALGLLLAWALLTGLVTGLARRWWR